MNETFAQGIAVMCIGMTTVLAFLCIAIAAMHIMSAIVRKLNLIFPATIPQVNTQEDDNIAIAVLAALLRRK